jgi:tRNA 2-(methylsulfanyl)-N6-isopentenyladenosine37 hydroxylase
MKVAIDLLVASKPEWIAVVLANFDAFLAHHADAERKAAATAMGLIAKYPDRKAIIPLLIATAIEELEHFQSVYACMEARNIPLRGDWEEDPYVKALLAHLRPQSEDRFMDRLLLGSVFECRGAERFKMVYEHTPDAEMKKFYHHLWAVEAKHGNNYVKMALNYFSADQVYPRLEFWMQLEGQIIDQLPIRPALH